MAARDNRQVNTKVIAVSDSAALAKAAAERVMARIAANGDRIAICLTGGSSPKQLYRLLASCERSTQQYGDGAAGLSGSLCAGGQRPPNSNRHR
jgi:hypothetical protein